MCHFLVCTATRNWHIKLIHQSTPVDIDWEQISPGQPRHQGAIMEWGELSQLDGRLPASHMEGRTHPSLHGAGRVVPAAFQQCRVGTYLDLCRLRKGVLTARTAFSHLAEIGTSPCTSCQSWGRSSPRLNCSHWAHVQRHAGMPELYMCN